MPEHEPFISRAQVTLRETIERHGLGPKGRIGYPEIGYVRIAVDDVRRLEGGAGSHMAINPVSDLDRSCAVQENLT